MNNLKFRRPPSEMAVIWTPAEERNWWRSYAIELELHIKRSNPEVGAGIENTKTVQISGHGHVFPRVDGVRARCGGPPFCDACNSELARKVASEKGLFDKEISP